MPTAPEGVYRDRIRGTWYCKVTIGHDPATGRRVQVTRRGFASAAAAAKARRTILGRVDTGELRANRSALTLDELLDEYFHGLDADRRLAARTRLGQRDLADAHIRPHLGATKVRDLTPDALLQWQRHLATQPGRRNGTRAPNTIRLIRQPLAGALKMAVERGLIDRSPLSQVPPPRLGRRIPRHWTPEQARDFLGLMEGDRTWPIWAFLLGTGLRIGELVWLRWPNVDLERREVRVVEFASVVGHRLEPSSGKTGSAVRAVALDRGLVRVLHTQRAIQDADRSRAVGYMESDFVFTKPEGGSYHPQQLSRLVARLSQQMGVPRLSAHGLRHTAATLMLASGVPPKVAAERLGHADPVMFSVLYAHVTPTMQQDAAERVGSILFGDGDRTR